MNNIPAGSPGSKAGKDKENDGREKEEKRKGGRRKMRREGLRHGAAGWNLLMRRGCQVPGRPKDESIAKASSSAAGRKNLS